MARLGCNCGNTIRDQSDHLRYKAHLLPDKSIEGYFDWVCEVSRDYMVAEQEGRAGAWLHAFGFEQKYIDLNLKPAEVLNDIIYNKFRDLTRETFECEACGRIHVQRHKSQMFESYTADNASVNGLLSAGDASSDEPIA